MKTKPKKPGRPHGTFSGPGGRKRSVTIRMTEEERDKAEIIGNGKVGEGVRQALAYYPG